MDTRLEAAPQAPVVHHQLRFAGSGGEFFGIWIVNLALTIVTLGIFSAWAKVRNKRYFYGNTYVGEHVFDYHGSPLRILLGRVIALCLLLAYGATIHFAPHMVFVWGLAVLLGAPWLVKSALRFNARNTSYRNIRFNFTGSYADAFGAYTLWSLLAAITLFTTYPLARRARDRFVVNNHTFGGRNFHAEIPGGAMYRIYLAGLAIFLVFVAAAATIYLMVHSAPLDWHNPAAMAPLFLIVGGLYFFCVLLVATYIGTSVFNLVMGQTVLADRLHFESTLSPLAMAWIVFSNLVLTLITIGLFYPWAKVRMARYRAEHFAVTGPAEMDGFVSELVTGQGAVGEEIAGFFDIDIGL